MKRWVVISCCVVAVAAVVVVWQFPRGSVAPSMPASTALDLSPKSFIGVEELMRNTDRYQGALQVQGVVYTVSYDDQMFALIDLGEYQRCGVTNCAPVYLPVRWTGPMPSVTDFVKVKGSVEQTGNKLIFVARRFERIEIPRERFE